MFSQPAPYAEEVAAPLFTVPQPPIHTTPTPAPVRFEHEPTGEQQAILDAAGTGRPLTIEAGAGTGKTSTLKMLAAARPGERMLYLAYNRAIADEAMASFPGNVDCRTAHSVAFRAVGHQFKDRLNGPRLPAREVARFLQIPAVLDLGKHALTSVKVARLVMDAIKRFCYSDRDEPSAWHIPDVPGLEGDGMVQLREQAYPFLLWAWGDLQRPDGRLKFEHDHYLKIWALTNPTLPYNAVLLDEAQDANPVIARVVEAQAAQRILVGDQSQAIYCQPAGTLVTVVRGRYKRGVPSATEQIPIEQVKIGDLVVSYNEKSRLMRRAGAMVVRNEASNYDGDLITITTVDGKSSNYTADHHCVIRWTRECFKGAWFVYMMRRGADYRIGCTAAVHDSQDGRHGLALRISQEQPNAAWILGVYDDETEAREVELSLQARFAIPGWTFRAPSSNPMSQDELDRRWAARGPTTDSAAKLLTEHGLSDVQPLWHRGDLLPSFRASMVTTAQNLVSGMAVLDLERAQKLSAGKGIPVDAWRPFIVERCEWSGKVYSLSVAADHTYFADGLLTHNSWRGAVDAMASFDGQRLALSQSFRFGQAIADEANEWLELLDAPLRLSGNPAKDSRLGVAEHADAVLCRTNAGAVGQAMAALDVGLRPALVGGGDDIRRLAKACQDLRTGRGTEHPELMAFSSWDEVREYAEHDAGGADLRTLVKLVDGHGPEEILRVVDRLVDEHNADIVISTAHRAKGREWGSVRLAGDWQEPYDKDGKLNRGEAMLSYVAVTRARELLDCRTLKAAEAGGIGFKVLAGDEERAALVDDAPAVHRTTLGATGEAPPAEDSAAMDTLTPDPPRAETDLPAELVGWLQLAKDAAAHEASWKAVKEQAQQKLKDWLGDREEATVAGRPAVSWKTSKPGGQLDAKQLQADHPDIYAAYYKPKKASRPFNLLGEWK